MFNFFNDLKQTLKLEESKLLGYNIVNISNVALYVEGHLGIILLDNSNITFRVKKGVVVVSGSNLEIKKMTENSMYIQGKITKTELF